LFQYCSLLLLTVACESGVEIFEEEMGLRGGREEEEENREGGRGEGWREGRGREEWTEIEHKSKEQD
jgi:hypothetical protein